MKNEKGAGHVAFWGIANVKSIYLRYFHGDMAR